MMTTGRNFLRYVTLMEYSHNIVGRGWVHRFRVDKMARPICTRLKNANYVLVSGSQARNVDVQG